MIRFIFAIPIYIGSKILELVVHMLANFIAMVLNHPAVQDAGASTIVAGMKQLCHEDDLDEHVEAMSETLSRHMERDARNLGKDFPKLWGQFVKGLMTSNDKDKKQREEEKKLEEEKKPQEEQNKKDKKLEESDSLLKIAPSHGGSSWSIGSLLERDSPGKHDHTD
jgi:hypothetical protein